MKSLLAAVAALVAVSASAASAAPLTAAKPKFESATEQVRLDPAKPRHRMHRHHRHGHWRDDPRYERYRGWHRYSYRPRGWRDRGCIAIGPIWFCP